MGPSVRDEDHLDRSGPLGSYRSQIGWGRGRTPGALRAIGPSLNPASSGTSGTPSVITS